MASSVLAAFLLPFAVSTMAIELPYLCSFENRELCEMEPRQGGDFNWTRQSGWTPSAGTGPDSAADGSWYIYIESSHAPPDNRKTGDRAYIQTPTIGYAGDVCIRFRYHMYGYHIGRLVVFVDTRGENSSTTFTKNGNNDKTWHNAEVNVEGFRSGERVVFMAECGEGQQGDIALDDLQISKGLCPAALPTSTPSTTRTTPSTRIRRSTSSTTNTPDTPVMTNTTLTVQRTIASSQPPSMTTARFTGQQTENTTGLEDQINYCIEAYIKVVDADQAFESACETEELLFNEPRDQCLREACRRGVEVVAVRNEVCDLKLCHDGDIQLAASAGSLGWDIFVLNRTRSESLDDQPSADQGHSNIPLWQVIVAAIVVGLAVMGFAVGIVLYLKRRKMASQAKEPDRVYYENDAALPPRRIGDVTEPADEAPYEDLDSPPPVTASAVQIPMSPPRSDPEDPNPSGYEDLEPYEPRVGGPYDVII